ncbi:hypothetical protein [Wolbachia endosymbiont of Folsomia candida]|uniref:hypothetical protein n=1 Tax=Wolbachia endosymbiont of Folsomia candida TaxID=169402 RepID=UPI000A6B48C8|nr:hypothetical protein [Wolbachia endosymbiont of Folsomia candida]APR98480.1 hypothetical protein ASM33_04410 [Wolbachia endosymbiont of Folsomia candida]
MRKIFIYIIVSLFLFIPTAYSGFWYFSAWKAKNLLVETISYINDEKFDVSYDFSGFPFSFVFRITNPKISNEQLTVSSEALLVKNRLFDKSVYIYIPSNEINIADHSDEKKSIKCNINDNSRFIVKLNDLPSSLRFDGNNTVIDYINTLRYEDYGLQCDISSNSENQKSIATEVNDRSNYIEFNFNKALDANAKLGFDFYIYRYKNAASPENYLSIDTKFDYEFVNEVSSSRINFNMEKFLIQSSRSLEEPIFSLTADGRINNYNLATSSFKGKINVDISNYKELISFLTGEEFSKSYPKASSAFEKFIPSLSEKTDDTAIQFTIRYDDDIGSGFIGKLSTADFMDKLSKITKLLNDQSSN